MSAKAEATSSEVQGNASNSRSKTTDRIAQSAHEVIDESASKAKVVEEKLRDSAEEASEKADATQKAAVESIRETTDKAEAFARERPIAAAGIAFAAGVLTAAILRR